MGFFRPTWAKVLLAILLLLIPFGYAYIYQQNHLFDKRINIADSLFLILFFPFILLNFFYVNFFSDPIYNLLTTIGILPHFYLAYDFIVTSFGWLILGIMAYLLSCTLVFITHQLKQPNTHQRT